MPTKTRNRTLRGAQLNAAVASKIFGWKNVRRYNGELIGKKQDRAGRWRKAKVPDYAGDPRQAYAINDRMEKLGRNTQYLKELSGLTRAKKLPSQWATPEQRSRAALKAMPS